MKYFTQFLFFVFLLSSCDRLQSSLETAQKKKEFEIKQANLKAAQELEASKYTYKETTIKKNQGMYQALKEISLSNIESLSIINLLSDKVEFNKLKVGDKLKATFYKGSGLTEFSFSDNPAESHILKINPKSKEWSYEYDEKPTFWASRVIEGNLSPGSTLQADLLKQGLKRSVVAKVVNILMCKVNFRLYARAGDSYRVLLQERLFQDQILDTNVLYTSYEGKRVRFKETFFYNDGNKSTYTAHYTPEGEALVRSALRYPVRHLHIRSSYGKRRHPVTGRYTMHRGVDLRGRTGSPVYAVARGIVVESSYNSIAGNKIAIKHNDNSISYYLHLKNRSVRKGQRVKSHQIIGRVGATGRVTGPHLHFGFKKPNGRWMNPMNKRMIATPKLKGERLLSLKEQIKKIRSIYSNLTDTKISRNLASQKDNNNI